MHRLAFVLLLTFLALTASARAEDVRYYDIETIIFESLDPAARASENWKSDISRQIPPVVAELDQPYPGKIPPQYDPKLTFKTLPSSQFQLNTEENLLANSKQYRILLHTAWVQPGMGPDTALPIHITRTFLTETPVTHSLIPATPDTTATSQSLPTAEIQTRSVLDGYIKIILTRYLHADVDLVYTTGLPLSQAANSASSQTPGSTSTYTPESGMTTAADATSAQGEANNATSTLPPPVIYRLHQSRRMRSNKLHYLDHPVLGMLLLITPHETK